MKDQLLDILSLLHSGLISLRNTDFNQVQYVSLGLALGAGLFLILVWMHKILLGRNNSRRPYSGHAIPREYLRSNTGRLIYLLPKFILVLGVLFLLLALANPYLPRTKMEERIESRERIDLIDVSSSKGWEFKKTGKSAGQISREGFIQFLKMRRGQNDRVSLQLFGSEHHVVEDFITDDDLYLMQAEDAPYVYTSANHESFPENDEENERIDFIAPRDRILIGEDKGGTNLNFALDQVIKYYDLYGDKRLRQRSLLIETDGAAEDDPIAQFRELKKRNVLIYFLEIEPNLVGEKEWFGDKALVFHGVLKKRVREYGGKFYNVKDEQSLKAAYQDINKLEKIPLKLIRHALRVFIYQRPLLFGVLLLFIGVSLGLLVERSWGESP